MLLTAWLAWRVTLRVRSPHRSAASADAVGVLWCAAVFCVTVWSFAALAGMLGRYRYLAWVALVAAVLFAIGIAGIPFFDLPVIRLLGQDVQMAIAIPESTRFRLRARVAVPCAVGAAALALAGSGAMASTLAQRMTARERVFALVALIAVSTISYTLDPKPVQPPFEITGRRAIRGSMDARRRAADRNVRCRAARLLARTIADDADSLIDALDLGVHPPVFVLPQQGLDRDVMQRAAFERSRRHRIEGRTECALRPRPNAGPAFAASRRDAQPRVERGPPRAARRACDVLGAARGRSGARAMVATRRGRRRAVAGGCPHGMGADHRAARRVSVPCDRVQCVRHPRAASWQRRRPTVDEGDIRHAKRRRASAARATPCCRARRSGVDWASLAAAARARGARASATRRARARPLLDAAVDWRSTAGQGIAIETTLSGAARYAAYYVCCPPHGRRTPATMSRLDVLGSSAMLPLSPRATRVCSR